MRGDRALQLCKLCGSWQIRFAANQLFDDGSFVRLGIYADMVVLCEPDDIVAFEVMPLLP